MSPLLSTTDLLQLMTLIRDSRHVAICGHRGPDGDAMGSALAWSAYLQGLGKQVSVVMPTPPPDFLRWLPGSKQVVIYQDNPTLTASIMAEADLICCLDFNALSRLQDLQHLVAASKAKRLIIDHHLNPDTEGISFLISRPQMCSTCEVIFRLIHQLGGFDDMTPQTATCIYTGMMTDTGGFTYNSNDPEVYEIISLLLTKGIDKDRIYRQVFHVFSIDRLRLQGFILSEKLQFFEKGRASVFTLTREEMKRFRYVRGDLEGFVNLPLQVRGLSLSISLREDTEKDVIRCSLRSVGSFPCNKMAEQFFHGGGHLNASGGELPFPLEEALKTAERAIEAFRDLL